jgi:hypothetical protein
MAIRSLKNGTFSRSLLVGNSYYDPYAFQSIATATGNGSSSSITFSSIPSTYTHLQVRGICRSSGAGGQLYIRLNGNAGTNYSYHQFFGDGTGVSANVTGSSSTVIYYADWPASTQPANCYLAQIIDVIDYTSTSKNKTVRILAGYDNNGDITSQYGRSVMASGAFYNTSAITSLSIVANAAFDTTSTFALYGIKGA